MKKIFPALIAIALCGTVQAKLPPPTPEAQAAAAAAKDKAAWASKVAAYKLCLAQNKIAADYMKKHNVEKKPSPEVPACTDPGPYVAAQQQTTQVGVADAKPVPAAGQPQPAAAQAAAAQPAAPQPAQAADGKK